jgi:hypothetical protein
MVELAKQIAMGLIVGSAGDPCPAGDGPVRVTVVVVLATAKNADVDPKLRDLAREVRKLDPTLTGLRIGGSARQSIPVGAGHTFDLVDGRGVRVRVERPKGPDGRVGLRIRLPDGSEMTYTCVCDRFVPLHTFVRTKDGDHVIVAVMAKPCTVK